MLQPWNFEPFSQILLETIAPNLDSNFRIFGQSIIKENFHNSRTSDDIDMKLRPVTKLHSRNKKTSIKFDDDVISENCDVISIFPTYR